MLAKRTKLDKIDKNWELFEYKHN